MNSLSFFTFFSFLTFNFPCSNLFLCSLEGEGRRLTVPTLVPFIWLRRRLGQQWLRDPRFLPRSKGNGKDIMKSTRKNAFLLSDFFLLPFHAFPLPPFFSAEHAQKYVIYFDHGK